MERVLVPVRLFVACVFLAADLSPASAGAQFFVQSALAFAWTSEAPRSTVFAIERIDYSRYYEFPG